MAATTQKKFPITSDRLKTRRIYTTIIQGYSKLFILYGFIIKRPLKTRETVVWGIPSSRLAQLFDFLGPRWKHTPIICALSSDMCGRPVLLPAHRHPVSSNCRYHRRMLWAPGGCSATSTTLTLYCDYRFTPQKLQHTKNLLVYGRHFLTDCRGATATVEPSRGDLPKLGDFLLHLVDAKLIHGRWEQIIWNRTNRSE